MEQSCIHWPYLNGKVHKKCQPVTELEGENKELNEGIDKIINEIKGEIKAYPNSQSLLRKRYLKRFEALKRR